MHRTHEAVEEAAALAISVPSMPPQKHAPIMVAVQPRRQAVTAVH
jgi:hypothetical protein